MTLNARDDSEGLTQGGYFYARIASHDGLDDATNGLNPRDFGWVEGTVDARGYIPLFGDRTSLALRFFTELNDPKGGSAIPFYYLAKLGGNSSLRGFQTFRFYGENSILFQGELRRTVWARSEIQGADVIFFGDVGQVWGKGFDRNCPIDITGFNPQVGQDFDTDNYEADLGFGVSYRFSRKFGVRLDFAHSNEDDKIRFSFSKGF